MKRSARNIQWIEKHCIVPDGKGVGLPMRLREWQRDELKKIYDNPAGTRQAIISFPRKNGKTALVGALLNLHLCGPEAKKNSQLYSAAMSKEQAAIIYKLASKMVRMSPTLSQFVTCRDTVKEMFCAEIGTLYAALSAEKSTAHGKSPIFAVHDELGQVKGPISELYDAIETGMGAHENPLSIVISTQAPTDDDLLSRLIDHALTESDPHTVVSVYSAPDDADPFSEKTLKACNPAWGDFLNAGEVMRTMEQAKALPSQEPGFRNLHLNQRVDMNSPFVSTSIWKACNQEPLPLGNMDVYAGLDLSETRDLTAFVAAGVDGDTVHVHPTFWLPADGLAEKSRADRTIYDQWAREGTLQTCPGKTVDYSFVAMFLAKFIQTNNVRKIGFDRWNFRHLRPWLERAGISEATIDEIFVDTGQGYKTMSPALRDLETMILNQRIQHGDHPVLTMCAMNTTIKTDEVGNRKPDKIKSHGRIDGMVALAMAAAVMPEGYEVQQPSPWEDPDFRLGAA